MLSVTCPVCCLYFSADPRGHWLWCPDCGQPIDATIVMGAAAFAPPASERSAEEAAFATPAWGVRGIALPMAG
jgi:hypothetical protein